MTALDTASRTRLRTPAWLLALSPLAFVVVTAAGATTFSGVRDRRHRVDDPGRDGPHPYCLARLLGHIRGGCGPRRGRAGHGGPSASPRLQRYFTGTAGADPLPFPDLTDRERDVLAQLAQGRSNTEIAAALHLTPKAVRNYVSAVLTKLQVRDRAQAIVKARDAGFPD